VFVINSNEVVAKINKGPEDRLNSDKSPPGTRTKRDCIANTIQPHVEFDSIFEKDMVFRM